MKAVFPFCGRAMLATSRCVGLPPNRARMWRDPEPIL